MQIGIFISNVFDARIRHCLHLELRLVYFTWGSANTRWSYPCHPVPPGVPSSDNPHLGIHPPSPLESRMCALPRPRCVDSKRQSASLLSCSPPPQALGRSKGQGTGKEPEVQGGRLERWGLWPQGEATPLSRRCSHLRCGGCVFPDFLVFKRSPRSGSLYQRDWHLIQKARPQGSGQGGGAGGWGAQSRLPQQAAALPQKERCGDSGSWVAEGLQSPRQTPPARLQALLTPARPLKVREHSP